MEAFYEFLEEEGDYTPPTPMTEKESSLDHRQLRIIEDCARDRIYFVEAVLGVEPESWQREIW